MARISPLGERILIALVRDGQWQIDASGRIWRVSVRKGLKAGGSHVVPVQRRRVEKTLPTGYLQVRAMINGKRVHAGAHRLVWQHFKGDISVGHEINHRNGFKDDNRPHNLECCAASANIRHAHRGGLIDQYGQRNPAAKLTDNAIAQIRLAYSQGGYTMEQLAARFGVSFQHISKIVRGQRRPKQGGPTTECDQRHCVSKRDANTGRFVGKKLAGRAIDGVVHDDFPR